MSVIEKPVEILASIDPFFSEDDHFVCCAIPNDFMGATTTFCGIVIMDASMEEIAEVSCKKCMTIAYGSVGFCPINPHCKDFNYVKRP